MPGTYLGEAIGNIAPLIIIVSKLTVIAQTHTHTHTHTTTVPLHAATVGQSSVNVTDRLITLLLMLVLSTVFTCVFSLSDI